MAYNSEHGIIPRTVSKSIDDVKQQKSILDIRGKNANVYIEPDEPNIAADPILEYMDRDQLEVAIENVERKMKKAAKELDFISAAQYRDEMFALRKKWKEKWCL